MFKGSTNWLQVGIWITLVFGGCGYEKPGVNLEEAAPLEIIEVDQTVGFLTVSSTPAAEVHLNGTSLGQTPIHRMEVRAGTHTVLFVCAGCKPNKMATELEVEVRAGDTTHLAQSFQSQQVKVVERIAAEGVAKLTINSRPWSDVYVDGSYAGKTPVADYPVVAGTHTILFQCGDSCPPGTTHEKQVTIGANEDYKLVYRFE